MVPLDQCPLDISAVAGVPAPSSAVSVLGARPNWTPIGLQGLGEGQRNPADLFLPPGRKRIQLLDSQNSVYCEDKLTSLPFLQLQCIQRYFLGLFRICFKDLLALGSELDLTSTIIPRRESMHSFRTQSVNVPHLLITFCMLSEHILGRGFKVRNSSI